MPEYSFTLTEHDAERPWIVVNQERRSVALAEGVSFLEWARAEWPPGRFTVQLDPWQLKP